MANSVGGSGNDGPNTPEELPQHPLVERLKPDPSQPAKKVIVLIGLPGKSDRQGYQRLYLTTKLDYYAEFLASDMVYAEAVPTAQSPFSGQEATRVTVGRDATVHYIWAKSAQPIDEFDLDIRLGAQAAGPTPLPLPISPPDGCGTQHTQCGTCVGQTCRTCAGEATCAATCHTCPATCPATCQTCQGQNTCAGHGTCVNTQCVQVTCVFTGPCNQGTCNTCVFTQCNQQTCANTQCQQATCITCPANATCPQTCVA